MIADTPSKSPKDFAIDWRRSSDLDRRVRLQAARIRLQPLSLRQSLVSYRPPSVPFPLPVTVPPPASFLPPVASSPHIAEPSVAPVPPAAPAPAVTMDPDEAAKLRAKYTRFRILVIGRANAGKTTLLKRVCNTTEEPSIYEEGKNLVSYLLIMISHSHHLFIISLIRPRRYPISGFCTFLRVDDWFRHCSGGSTMFVVRSLSRAAQVMSSTILLDSRLAAKRNLRLWWLSFKRDRRPMKLTIKSMSSGTFYHLPWHGSNYKCT